jgi:hypothetical protein
MKRNAGGYPSSMFLGSDCSRDSQSIENLFAGFFQSVYVRDDCLQLKSQKSGDKRDVSCYRGISILLAIPKLFEIMACDRITPVVRPVISDAVFISSFVKGRCQYLSPIYEWHHRRNQGWVYPDFSKPLSILSTGCFTVC